MLLHNQPVKPWHKHHVYGCEYMCEIARKEKLKEMVNKNPSLSRLILHRVELVIFMNKNDIERLKTS
jgi:hypothetical protein